MSIKWTSNNTIKKVEYSTNNGSSYTTYTSSISAKSGNVSVSSLTRNTAYNIKIRVTDSNGTVGTSSTLAVTTYQYPYVSAVGVANLTIGNDQTLTLYNPLGRNVTVYMKKTSTSGTQLYSGTTSGTSLNFTPNATTLYNSITTAQSATCVYYCVYSSTTVSTVSGTYKVDATASAPTVSGLTYADENTTVTDLTNNPQLIVQNQSLCGFTASGISAKNSATISSVKVTVVNVDHAMTYSSGSASVAGFRINSSSNTKATVTVTDSRGLTATASVTVQMLAWTAPTALINMQRQNNFYSETDIKVDAIYSSVNQLNTVTIEYTATADGETTITGTLSDNVEATFIANNEKDWNVQITVTDKFATAVYTRVLSRGTPIIFFDNNLNSVGVNCFPTDAESLEVVSTDGSTNHNVAEELEFHNKEITGYINGLPISNIDQFPVNNIYGTFWLNAADTNITGTKPITSGQGLLFTKRQSSAICRQAFIGITSESDRVVRYYTYSTGTWTAWSQWASETKAITPNSFSWIGTTHQIRLHRNGNTVQCVLNFNLSGSMPVSTFHTLGTIPEELRPIYTFNVAVPILNNATHPSVLVTFDASTGNIQVYAYTQATNTAGWFRLNTTWLI